MKVLVLSTGFLVTMGPVSALAKSAYVSDVMYIPVRSGASNQHRILKHLRSGTEVRVLRKLPDSEYSKIRVRLEDKNLDGFVKHRYLLDEPIAAVKLEKLEKRYQELRDSPLARSVDDLRTKLDESENQNRKLATQNETLTSEIEEIRRIAAKPAEVFEANKQLLAEKKALGERLEALETENIKLQDDQRNEGIKLGLLAVALGGLAGFLLPYFKPRGRQQRSIRLH